MHPEYVAELSEHEPFALLFRLAICPQIQTIAVFVVYFLEVVRFKMCTAGFGSDLSRCIVES